MTDQPGHPSGHRPEHRRPSYPKRDEHGRYVHTPHARVPFRYYAPVVLAAVVVMLTFWALFKR